MKYFAMALLGLMLAAGVHRISNVERSGSWVYMYDEHGNKYKTLSANSVGEVLGFSSTFFVSRSSSWIYTWDYNGKRINTRSAR